MGEPVSVTSLAQADKQPSAVRKPERETANADARRVVVVAQIVPGRLNRSAVCETPQRLDVSPIDQCEGGAGVFVEPVSLYRNKTKHAAGRRHVAAKHGSGYTPCALRVYGFGKAIRRRFQPGQF